MERTYHLSRFMDTQIPVRVFAYEYDWDDQDTSNGLARFSFRQGLEKAIQREFTRSAQPHCVSCWQNEHTPQYPKCISGLCAQWPPLLTPVGYKYRAIDRQKSLQCPPRYPLFYLFVNHHLTMSIAGSLTPRDVTPTLSVLGKQLLACCIVRVLTVFL